MRRRKLLLLGGGAITMPAVQAQPAMPVVGWVHPGRADGQDHAAGGFLSGLQDGGYSEGRSVAIEWRWADEHPDRLPDLVLELVRLRPMVMVAAGVRSASLAKAATSSIPLVFMTGDDPVRLGLVASWSRPGGNATGIVQGIFEVLGKQIELLDLLLPKRQPIAALLNPNAPFLEAERNSLEAAAQVLQRQLLVFFATSDQEFEAAFVDIKQQQGGGLVIGIDVLFSHHSSRLASLAKAHRLPTSRAYRQFPEAGGLFSYGPDIRQIYRELGRYTARVLRGIKPAELPVQRLSTVEMVINLGTARAIGIDLPALLIARADTLIE